MIHSELLDHTLVKGNVSGYKCIFSNGSWMRIPILIKNVGKPGHDVNSGQSIVRPALDQANALVHVVPTWLAP